MMANNHRYSNVFLAIRNNDEKLLRDTLNYLQSSKRHWLDYTQGNSGDTMLHVAARVGHLGIMRILCEEWADSEISLEVNNFDGKKCLHEAAQASHPQIVNYLIKQGAEIDSLKNADWTPLMIACTKVGRHAYETIEIILKSRGSVSLTNKDGWTPLHIAVREGDCNIISLLLSFHSDVSAVTKNGRTTLHIAAFHGHVKVVEMLLNTNKVPVNYKDSCGVTPLHEAIRGGCVDIVNQLLEKGASLNQTDAMGLSCIHLAAQIGHSHMITFLVKDCGIDVNLLSQGIGLSPLHCAARADQVTVVVKLLELGASPNVMDNNGRTVADSAYGNKGEEIKRILENCR